LKIREINDLIIWQEAMKPASILLLL